MTEPSAADSATPRPTPGQTIGPFFGPALPYQGGDRLVERGHPEAIRLSGRVLDGDGAAVPDALLELWQAGPDGTPVQQAGSLHRDGWTFTGWGRVATDAEGTYSFTTLTPGAQQGSLPFFAITVFARGLLDRLFTRAYLPAAPDALAGDPLLSTVDPARRDTLLTAVGDGGYRFDVVLQGEGETVFLEYGPGGQAAP